MHLNQVCLTLLYDKCSTGSPLTSNREMAKLVKPRGSVLGMVMLRAARAAATDRQQLKQQARRQGDEHHLATSCPIDTAGRLLSLTWGILGAGHPGRGMFPRCTPQER
eukprot:1160418-Pelagomonas_calceolata.AAC.11